MQILCKLTTQVKFALKSNEQYLCNYLNFHEFRVFRATVYIIVTYRNLDLLYG